MKISWSDLTCHTDWYSFRVLRSSNQTLHEYIISFKIGHCIAKAYVFFEEIPEKDIYRAVSVNNIVAENEQFKAFLEGGSDTLLALCNIYRQTWVKSWKNN